MMQRKTIHQAGNRDGVFGLFLILCILAALNPSESHAWLIFHKPEYRGKIIDAETKKPLEGVVVVAIYSTSDVIGGPGGPSSREIGAREALTDEKGIFIIPSYTVIMNPIAREDPTGFIIFKPGYACWGAGQVDKILPFSRCRTKEPYYFPRECYPCAIFTKPIGSREEIIKNPRKKEKITITNGIVELTRLDTWDERDTASAISRPDFNLPILHKMIAEENRWQRNHKGWKREK